MDASDDMLIPIILVTIAINVAIIALAVAYVRSSRARRLAALDGMLASSYVDHEPRNGFGPATVGDAEQAELALTEPVSDDIEAQLADDGGSEDHHVTTADLPALEADAAAPADGSTHDGRGDSPRDRGSRDPLTGLLDAAAFDDILAHEESRLGRYRRPATIVVFELDGLERLVDRLGPAAGDRVVPALADTIQRLARGADYVARLEPGRFAVFLPETDEIAAINYVERVRRAAELWLESGAIAMRLAIGWAGSAGDVTLASALRTATERMHVELRRLGRQADAEAEIGTSEDAPEG